MCRRGPYTYISISATSSVERGGVPLRRANDILHANEKGAVA